MARDVEGSQKVLLLRARMAIELNLFYGSLGVYLNRWLWRAGEHRQSFHPKPFYRI